MSYSGTQVYFPRSTSLGAIRDVLASRFPEAKLTANGGNFTLAFDGVKVIRVTQDAASHVPDEAKWHGEKATDDATRAALHRAAYRVEIVPADPRADFDDMYNELLFVFEVLRDMPDAVGADPFDGALYHNAANATAASKPASKSKPKAKAKAKAKTKAKPSAKAKAKAKARKR